VTPLPLQVIDTERLTQVASMALEGRGQIVGLGSDTAYVAAHVGFESTVLRRVSLADLRMEQVRKLDGGVGELFFPNARR